MPPTERPTTSKEHAKALWTVADQIEPFGWEGPAKIARAAAAHLEALGDKGEAKFPLTESEAKALREAWEQELETCFDGFERWLTTYAPSPTVEHPKGESEECPIDPVARKGVEECKEAIRRLARSFPSLHPAHVECVLQTIKE